MTGNQQHKWSDLVPVKDKHSLVGMAASLKKSLKKIAKTVSYCDQKKPSIFSVTCTALTAFSLFASHRCRIAFVDKVANSYEKVATIYLFQHFPVRLIIAI